MKDLLKVNFLPSSALEGDTNPTSEVSSASEVLISFGIFLCYLTVHAFHWLAGCFFMVPCGILFGFYPQNLFFFGSACNQ